MDDAARAHACERQRGQETCPFHPGHNVTSLCKTCGILVCLECITSIVHDGHIYRKIKDSLREPNDNIAKYLNIIDNTLLVAIDNDICTTKADRKTAIQNHEKKIKCLRDQETKFKNDIEKTTESMAVQMYEHLQNVLESLDKHEHALESQRTQLRQEREDYAEILEKGQNILRYDAGNEVERKPQTIALPVYPTNPDLDHIACKDAEEIIQKAIGVLTQIENTSIPSSNASQEQHKAENPGKTPYEPIDVKPTPTAYSAVKILHSFDSSNPLYYPVVPVTKDTAWAGEFIYNEDTDKCNSSKSLYNISNTGESLSHFQTDTKVRYITFHPTTGQMYGGFADSTIRRINTTNGSTTTVIQCTIRANRIDVSRDNHVLVGRTGNKESVYRYKLDGELVNISTEKYRVWDITLCDVSSKVAICSGKEGVAILDKNLNKIQTFTGLTGQNREEFASHTSIFDYRGNLIVSDYKNNEIYIVDGNKCTLIQKLQIGDLTSPFMMRLCQNILWVTCKHPAKVLCIEMK